MSNLEQKTEKKTHRQQARIEFSKKEGKTLSIRAINGDRDLCALLLNISSGGLAVHVAHEDYQKYGPIGLDDLLSADLSNAGINDLMPMVKVVRLQTVEDGYLFGLKFHCLTRNSEENIERYVNRNKLKQVLITEQYLGEHNHDFSENLNFSEKVVMAAQYFYFKTKEALNINDPAEESLEGRIVPLVKSSIDSEQLWIGSPFWFDKSA